MPSGHTSVGRIQMMTCERWSRSWWRSRATQDACWRFVRQSGIAAGIQPMARARATEASRLDRSAAPSRNCHGNEKVTGFDPVHVASDWCQRQDGTRLVYQIHPCGGATRSGPRSPALDSNTHGQMRRCRGRPRSGHFRCSWVKLLGSEPNVAGQPECSVDSNGARSSPGGKNAGLAVHNHKCYNAYNSYRRRNW